MQADSFRIFAFEWHRIERCVLTIVYLEFSCLGRARKRTAAAAATTAKATTRVFLILSIKIGFHLNPISHSNPINMCSRHSAALRLDRVSLPRFTADGCCCSIHSFHFLLTLTHTHSLFLAFSHFSLPLTLPHKKTYAHISEINEKK